jgi:hypothetical protein
LYRGLTSTPRRPHKIPAHTVKDLLAVRSRISSLRWPEHFVPTEPHILQPISFSSTPCVKLFSNSAVRHSTKPFISQRLAVHTSRQLSVEGARILHPLSVSSTPTSQFFSRCRHLRLRSPRPPPRRRLAPHRRAANPTPDSHFVNPLFSNLFKKIQATPSSQGPSPLSPERPPGEGPRILHPILNSSTQRLGNGPRQDVAGHGCPLVTCWFLFSHGLTQDVRVRSCAYRPAARLRNPRRKCAARLLRPHHQSLRRSL